MDPDQSLAHLYVLLGGARWLHAEQPWLFPSLFMFILTVLASSRIGSSAINVPTVRPPTLLSFFTTPFKWLHNSRTLVLLGMDLHGRYGRPFKIPSLSRWYVVFTTPDLIEELKGLPQSIMSFRHASEDQLRPDLSLRSGLVLEAVLSRVLMKHLQDGKSLSKILPMLQEEHRLGWIDNAPAELQDAASTVWVAVDAKPTVEAIITRTTNRIFFGVELARNKDFGKAILEYALKLPGSASRLNGWPKILQPFVVKRIYAWKQRSFATLQGFLSPTIEERKQKLQTLGDEWKDRPHDAIQWVLEDEPEASTEVIICRLILLDVASLYTVLLTMTQILYDLAAYRNLQPLLRDEILKAKGRGDLTFASLSSCTLLDSTLRESSRMNGIDMCTIRRRCMEPYTFADGTHITKDDWVVIPAPVVHRLDSVYPNPDVFDAHRFQRLRSAPGKENSHQYVQTSVEFLSFGYGSRACPGRFFAVLIMKVLVAELVGKTEWKFRDGEERPKSFGMGAAIIPGSAKMLFRRLPETAEREEFSTELLCPGSLVG